MRFLHRDPSHISRQDSASPAAAPADQPQSVDQDIVFPPEHPLCQLRTLWSGEADSSEPLRLSLLSDEYDHLPLLGESLPREIQRLRRLLTDTARARMGQIIHGGPSLVDLDERALVFVTRDEMLAWLFLLPPVGQGQALSGSQLQQALLQYGVTSGIHWKVLRRLHDLPQRWFRLLPIAQGTAAMDGQDGRIVDHYPRAVGVDVQVDALANANYEALKLVRDIEENDVICEIHPATRGTDGITVTGRVLPAADGQAVTVPQGRNTRLSDDKTCLVAACRGHLAFSGRSFQVKQVLHIHREGDVPEQGVKFLGDVHIHCDLNDGASVCAIGTVQIDGVVGACSVEAGENIIVASGVQGQDRAVLHAQRAVYAKYLEHCTVYAQESVQADCIISCSICSNGTVKARTGRGTIIGGTVRASREISAVTVGSKAERKTALYLGGVPCEEAERMQVLQEIQAAERTMAELSRSQDSDAALRLSKLRLNQCVAKMKLEKFDRDLESCLANTMADETPRLICDSAYPGVVVTIRHKEYSVTQLERNCIIGITGGRIAHI